MIIEASCLFNIYYFFAVVFTLQKQCFVKVMLQVRMNNNN